MKNPDEISPQINPTHLPLINELAEQQSPRLQDISNETVNDYIPNVQTDKALRPHVMKAFQHSLLKHDTLYKKLAK